MIDKLLKIFANYTRSLEMLYLLDGLKAAVRLDADNIEIAKIRNFCSEDSLFMEISDFKVVKTADEGKGGYSNKVKRIPLNQSGAGLHHIYISKDKNKAKFLKIVEGKNDDNAVGEILNYPKCCINFFVENREKQRTNNDFILPALSNSTGFEFPFYNNYAARYFDITLLSHFPHDFNCKESIKIAKNNLECIKSHSKELADKFENALKSPVLYTETHGIFIFEDFKFKNSMLQYNKVKSTANSELFNLLAKNKKIEILDKNTVKIKNRIFDDIGFMLFT